MIGHGHRPYKNIILFCRMVSFAAPGHLLSSEESQGFSYIKVPHSHFKFWQSQISRFLLCQTSHREVRWHWSQFDIVVNPHVMHTGPKTHLKRDGFTISPIQSHNCISLNQRFPKSVPSPSVPSDFITGIHKYCKMQQHNEKMNECVVCIHWQILYHENILLKTPSVSPLTQLLGGWELLEYETSKALIDGQCEGE